MVRHHDPQVQPGGGTGIMSSSLNLIVGGYYQHSDLSRVVRTDVNFPALGLAITPFTRTIYLRQKQEDLSGFADVTWKVTPQLTFELSARLSR
ncbi:MAG: hypothetical protein ABIS14_05885, partial [Sphingomonas sp.]